MSNLEHIRLSKKSIDQFPNSFVNVYQNIYENANNMQNLKHANQILLAIG